MTVVAARRATALTGVCKSLIRLDPHSVSACLTVPCKSLISLDTRLGRAASHSPSLSPLKGGVRGMCGERRRGGRCGDKPGTDIGGAAR